MVLSAPPAGRRIGAGSLFARYISHPFPSPLAGEGGAQAPDEGELFC